MPNSQASVCSSQSVDLAQIRQLNGWLESISSNSRRRANSTRFELVVTFMPSATGVAQAGARLRRPSTSTLQMRQEATLFTIFSSPRSR